MTDERQALAMEGVRFFGEISASISHEIKNVLAIVNENAGLLQDLVRMNAKGIPLTPERLNRAAESISRQVARGDRIVKDMNRFAHSADLPREELDLRDVVAFIPQLTARLIVMQGHLPRIEVPTVPVPVSTNRFFLEHLVWACLHQALKACTADQTVCVVAEPVDRGARIRFGGIDPKALPGSEDFPSPQARLVAGLLGARITVQQDENEIHLLLP
ncbi:hypothetical protein DSCO28_58160 [Desulfosarcina ovata subsp. sediminis]|uniref:histidine kinase n=1 Tax=Desulfosarcina ovata subsp. sediminis TaxID=885957 RepID=A0A5K7ZYT3_9BACT|nr:histidine kinase dimerization/phospho-acceptor domain-containing protein [Desulfosarcina ovata]BBO85250.1 hypothetical protein DSCO28_58160 [Desulfosarcina ovata subsp. sediminis]